MIWKHHTGFLSSTFPKHEKSITGMLMCLAKLKHQIPQRQTLAAKRFQATETAPPPPPGGAVDPAQEGARWSMLVQADARWRQAALVVCWLFPPGN